MSSLLLHKRSNELLIVKSVTSFDSIDEEDCFQSTVLIPKHNLSSVFCKQQDLPVELFYVSYIFDCCCISWGFKCLLNDHIYVLQNRFQIGTIHCIRILTRLATMKKVCLSKMLSLSMSNNINIFHTKRLLPFKYGWIKYYKRLIFKILLIIQAKHKS